MIEKTCTIKCIRIEVFIQKDPTRDLDIYLDIARNTSQQGDVEKIKARIQQRIDNGTLKIVDNYKDIEDIPGELIMKVLAFNPDLEKIERIGQELSTISSLLFHHHHVVI